eukprot:TRINITY_DN812_c0_g1_i5.p4 TRINITY_DN812_c0_g1~~TRINITY_DN812_c0_g1_i5.p4  ORF type:complete len:101 (-),score=0.69 TRINITY_DN812_c0_g1_i5:187-489(-)
MDLFRTRPSKAFCGGKLNSLSGARLSHLHWCMVCAPERLNLDCAVWLIQRDIHSNASVNILMCSISMLVGLPRPEALCQSKGWRVCVVKDLSLDRLQNIQ